MPDYNIVPRAIRTVVLAWMALWCAMPASAQCVMCYTTASASGSRSIAALKSGILILLIPTLAIFAGIGFVVYRRRLPYGDPVDGAVQAGWGGEATRLAGAKPDTPAARL